MKRVLEDPYGSFKEIVNKLAKNTPDRDLNFELEIHKKLLNFFQVGDYYYFVFNLRTAQFDFISEEIETLLGYDRDTITVDKFMSFVHPEDVTWFVNFENKVVEFFSNLRVDQVPKYKVRYDYRVKKSNGEYIRILHQVITIQYDERDGNARILRTLGIHTDITHLKPEGQPTLSLIGLEGEPSYINVAVDKVFTASPSIISEREKQVLHLLIEGRSSKYIAAQLSISAETVNKHRKNILRKTNSTSTPELVARAVKNGWL